MQVFIPKAQRDKVDPKLLISFLTQVQWHARCALRHSHSRPSQHGDVLTEEQIMEVVKETDVLNEVRVAAAACRAATFGAQM